MKYNNIEKGRFISRPNRFIANLLVDDKIVKAHVKNTGRCKELLVEGATAYLQHHNNENRKTEWTLISVEKGDRLVNIDSMTPNRLMLEWIQTGNFLRNVEVIRPEFTFGNSRIDFFVKTASEKVLIEVKGVTLEENNVAMFPDAPTERGLKHIEELCRSLYEGFKAYIIFIIQMQGVRCFTPNDRTHKAFADLLRLAGENGVEILAVDCDVGRDYICIKDEVPVDLKGVGLTGTR